MATWFTLSLRKLEKNIVKKNRIRFGHVLKGDEWIEVICVNILKIENG